MPSSETEVKMLTRKEKKRLKEIMQTFEWRTYKSTGMSKINGGYAEVYLEDYSDNQVCITAEWGEQDMGSGSSTNNIESYILPRKVLSSEVPLEKALDKIKVGRAWELE